MLDQAMTEQDRLQNHVDAIAEAIQNPPLVDHDADGEELPDDAVQCESNPSDCVMVHSYDRRVPAIEFTDEYTHASGAYVHLEDEDTWLCVATGQRWESFGSGFFWSDDGDLILGGTEVTNFGPMSGYDYLIDVLDIEYIVNGNREYIGARVLVAFGGPNIWINTRTNTIEGYWWGDKASANYSDEIDLDDALRELWECGS